MELLRLKHIIEVIFGVLLSDYIENKLNFNVKLEFSVLNDGVTISFMYNDSEVAVFNLSFLDYDNNSIRNDNSNVHTIILKTNYVHNKFITYSSKLITELITFKNAYTFKSSFDDYSYVGNGFFLYTPRVYEHDSLKDFFLESFGLKKDFEDYLEYKEVSDLLGEEVF